ncbi:MAG: reverse transcriptase domain-containing protein [Candidatus Thiodiazotropha sp.]
MLEIDRNSNTSNGGAEEKYLIGKADWTLWNEITEAKFRDWNSKCSQTKWESIEEMYTSFKEVFDECRDASVPKRSFKYNDRRTRPPWWNDKMTEIKKRLNKAKRNFKRRSIPQNYDALQMLEEEFKRVEEEQKDLWTNNLCDKISNSDTPKEMWESLRTLTSYQDLDGGNILPLLNEDNQPVFDLQGKCNILQSTFFSGKHLDNNEFDEDFKVSVEKMFHEIFHGKVVYEDLFDSTAINRDITLEETQAALEYLKPGKAAGPDKVFTDLLLRANEELIKAIHTLFLYSFKTGTLPCDWKMADVKFLRKSGKKNYNSASAYRPISLTSCLGKCLERIITVRLNGFIEHNNIIDLEQEGFRRFHSTTHALMRLVQDIFNGYNKKEMSLVAFIDMEKAFDSIWRDGLMVKMYKLGIRGTVWKWISNFLSSRRAKCFLKGTYGPEFETFVGLPQGSVISPVLFNIFLQDIYKNISCQKVKFADDGTIWSLGTDTKVLSKTVEQELQKIFEWTLKWRMKLSPEKTEICLFSRGNNNTDPSQIHVQLNGNDIKYNSSPKVLGLHLDESLTFQNHIIKTEQKANKVIGVLRQVKHVEQIKTSKLIQLYKSLICPILEYACPVWQIADAKRLDEIQRKALSLCLDSCANSGREALEVELGVKPLQIRRQELAIREGAKILSKTDQVLIKRSWIDWQDNINTERFVSPFGKIQLQLEDLQTETGTTTYNIEPEFSYQESLQPSKRRPEYWDRLGSSKSRSTEQEIESRSIIQSLLDSCTPDSAIAFTDGSCQPNPGPCGAGSCIFMPHQEIPVCLKKPVSNHSSILLGELVAILMTIDYITAEIQKSQVISNIHMFSDSQSAIGILKLGWQSTQHKHTVSEIKQKILYLENRNITVNMSWTPGHANIKGNEEADRLAKEASSEAATMTSESQVVTIADIKQAAIKLGLSQWQRQWESSETGRSLFKYKPKVSDKSKIDIPDTKSYRQIAKLRLGYNTLKNYQYKIGNTQSNLCTCGEIETVEHYLLDCDKYFNEREKMRTHIFNLSGTSDINCDILLGCSKNEFKDTYGTAICCALSDYITQTSRF